VHGLSASLALGPVLFCAVAGNRSFSPPSTGKILAGFSSETEQTFMVMGVNLDFQNLLFETSGSKSMMNMHIIAATEERWRRQAEAAQQEADKLPSGNRRDALVREARRLRTASQMDQWLSSSELRPPK
jgi:hypothetical protein